MAGKGDKQRSRQVSDEQFADNWDRAFKRRPDPKGDPERAEEPPRDPGPDKK